MHKDAAMADDDTTETDTDTTDDTEQSATDTLGAAGKKALDAERKARRDAERELKDATERLRAIEDAEKSAEQRLTEQIQALTKRAEAAEVDALRRRVAADRGLPADIVEFLTGTDEDSVVTQADKLAERLAAAAPPPPPASRPASLRSGNGEKTADTGLSPAQLAESVIRSRDGT